MGLWENVKNRLFGKPVMNRELEFAMSDMWSKGMNNVYKSWRKHITVDFGRCNLADYRSSTLFGPSDDEIQEDFWTKFECNKSLIDKSFEPIISEMKEVLAHSESLETKTKLEEVERKAEELKYYNKLAQNLTDVIVCDSGCWCSPKGDSSLITEDDLVKFAEFCGSAFLNYEGAFKKIEKARKILLLPESSRFNAVVQKAARAEERVRRIHSLYRTWEKIQELNLAEEKRECLDNIKYNLVVEDLPDINHDGQERETLRDSMLEKYRLDVEYTNDVLEKAISHGKGELRKISNFKQEVAEIKPPKVGDSTFPDCSKKKAEIERGLAEIESVKNEFHLYRELASRAIDEYICCGSKYVSPKNPNSLTAKDFEKLAELDKKFRSTDNGLENIEKIRKRLSEHERQNSSIAFAKPKETISEVRNAEIGTTADMSAISNTSPSARKGLQAYLHKAQKEGRLTGEKEESEQIKTKEIKETPEKAAPDRDDR